MRKVNNKNGECTLVIDSQGRILSATRSVQEIFGFSEKELRRKHCFEVLEGRDPTGNLYCFQGCAVMTMAKQGEFVHNFDIQTTNRAGEEIWLNVETTMDPTSADRGNPNIIHAFRLASSPKRLECMLQQVLSILNSMTGSTAGPAKSLDTSASISVLVTKFSLSPRETETLVLLTQGFVAKEIAKSLNISTATARTHIQKILKKLRVHSKLEAVAMVPSKNTSFRIRPPFF